MSGYPTIVHTEEGMRDGLQIESPDIILGPKAYRGAASPWGGRLTSYQRPDSLNGEAPAAEEAPAPSSVRALAARA